MGRGYTYELDRQMDCWLWSSDNFWKKVDRSAGDNECWSWTGSSSQTGGLFGIRRQLEDGTIKPQMTQARRVMYAETHGHWLDTRQGIYHSCCNKQCVNPRHFTGQRQSHKPKKVQEKPQKQPRKKNRSLFKILEPN